MHLVDSFGVSLVLDQTAAWFILLNAIVSIAVAWHERYKGRHHYFFILLALLHGCVNACFVSNDLFNLYVVIELTTICAFLLIGQGMSTRHLWNALRYIFLSNVGMLFYLLGVLLVYESAGDFSFASAVEAPPTARAMIVTGLLVKGGVFLPGLWLPQAHAEADAAVSALLSGVVVNIGLLPLIRLEACSPDVETVIRVVGFGGIFTGLALAFFQRDIKRLLACSTISQVGFVLIAPAAGPVYAFAHGIAKASLFLCAGRLPDRDLQQLKEKGVDRPIALPMVLAALSIAGCPLLFGFFAKYSVGAILSERAYGLVLLASVGTAAILTPIILIPQKSASWRKSPWWQAPTLLGVVLLVCGFFSGPYHLSALLKSVGVLAAGMLLHKTLLQRLFAFTLPGGWEKLEHVVGMTCVALILLIAAVYLP
ncbi:proton-conducting transporter transmembrane domain-containing protein [Pontiella sulfatireligans]|uniref:Na(+)/H(+) antiporter subunit D n=1 Tax=Pontiella sulfatireligans TaxID=2750658 RepID=A0A6C2USI6_9BACT|nr:proton-conducting transporter membrane subunit [Pontiella sulfatireligans]VGO23300.1 Na(+)/H(+) antiporter subunit D [Pontiella sulfatireligans]